MARTAWPILARKHPFAMGRAFIHWFDVRLRVRTEACADRQYRKAVETALAAQFGAPLPATLDWLIAAAWRRSIPADGLVAFLAALFDLQPIAGR